MSPNTTMAPLHFLALPTEIRLLIYSYVLPPPTISLIPAPTQRNMIHRAYSHALLTTCKQTHAETTVSYYNNTFHIYAISMPTPLFSQFSPAAKEIFTLKNLKRVFVFLTLAPGLFKESYADLATELATMPCLKEFGFAILGWVVNPVSNVDVHDKTCKAGRSLFVDVLSKVPERCVARYGVQTQEQWRSLRRCRALRGLGRKVRPLRLEELGLRTVWSERVGLRLVEIDGVDGGDEVDVDGEYEAVVEDEVDGGNEVEEPGSEGLQDEEFENAELEELQDEHNSYAGILRRLGFSEDTVAETAA